MRLKVRSKPWWLTAAVILVFPLTVQCQGLGIGYYKALDGEGGLTMGTGLGLMFGDYLTLEGSVHYINLGRVRPDTEMATKPWVDTRLFKLEVPLVLRIPVGVYELYLLGGGVLFYPTSYHLLSGNIDRDLRNALDHDVLNSNLSGEFPAPKGTVFGVRITLPIPSLRMQVGWKYYLANSEVSLDGDLIYADSDGTYGSQNYQEDVTLRLDGWTLNLGIMMR